MSRPAAGEGLQNSWHGGLVRGYWICMKLISELHKSNPWIFHHIHRIIRSGLVALPVALISTNSFSFLMPRIRILVCMPVDRIPKKINKNIILLVMHDC